MSDIRLYLTLRSLFIKRRLFRRYYWMLRNMFVGQHANLCLQSGLFRKMFT